MTSHAKMLSARLWQLTDPLRERVRLILVADDDSHLEPKRQPPPVSEQPR